MDDEVIVNKDAEVTGKILVPGRNGGRIRAPFDRASSLEANARRWAGVSRAARLGIAAAGEQLPGVDSRAPLRVIEYLAEVHTLNAADPSARNSVASLNAVLRLAYPEPQRNDAGQADVTPDAGDVAELVAVWRAAKAADPALADRARRLLDDSDGS